MVAHGFETKRCFCYGFCDLQTAGLWWFDDPFQTFTLLADLQGLPC